MICWLAGEQTAAYAHLATEAVAMGLSQIEPPAAAPAETPHGVHFAAGLRFAGMPAGLAVLRQEHRSQPADLTLLSLVVTPQLRRLGLARELLTWVRQQAQQLGWQALTVSYPLDHSCTAAMEKLTSATEGWHHTPGLLLLQLNRNGAAQLVERLTPLVTHARQSGRFGLTSWDDLPATVRNLLGPNLKAPVWAWPQDDHGNDPLHELDRSISTVLTDGPQPAGWLTAHRVGARLFRVSQWWVQPALQGTGAALLLLHRAVGAALQSPNDYEMGTFGMAPQNTQVIRLCKRKIAPLATGSCQQRQAQIQLAQEGG